jgi:phosphoenolpyruvate carboxykinase (ATP)
MLSAALSGDLGEVTYTLDPIFGFEVPNRCPDVPDEVLNPSLAWPSENEYRTRYHDLAARFIENFRKFEDHTDPGIIASGPKI